MNNTNLLTAAVAATLMLGPSVASAISFDFMALANGNERGYGTFTHTEDGLTVDATGHSADGTIDYYAYMDSGDAGLGVCKALTAADQCTPSSDDNVTYLERVRLSFDRAVTLNEVEFVNGDHGTSFMGDFDLVVDGGPAMTHSLTNIFSTNLSGSVFEFINLNPEGTSDLSNKYQFYIGSVDVAAVPLPAAAWMFGSGLLGLAGVARRRR